MATMINKLDDAVIEKEILGAMNAYANSVKLWIPLSKQNPLEMDEKGMRTYLKAQAKVEKAENEIAELAHYYPGDFKRITHTFKVEQNWF